MSGECNQCSEHCLDCKCDAAVDMPYICRLEIKNLPDNQFSILGMDGFETFWIDKQTIGIRRETIPCVTRELT